MKYVIVLGILIIIVSITHSEGTIVISTVEGSVSAIAEKVMAEAYKRIGMKLEVKKLPGERALQASNNGEVDGELYRKRDIDQTYPNLIVIPVAVVNIDEMVFTKKSKKFAVKSWDSLLPYRVGYRKGI
jgi:polar amino acid transport system substrate-binding protein